MRGAIVLLAGLALAAPATAAPPVVTASAAPRTAPFGGAATLNGLLRPAQGGRVQIYRGNTCVTSSRVAASGRFRARVLVRSPGPYHARFGAARSIARTIALRPEVRVRLPAVVPVGGALILNPSLFPRRAGSLRVRVLRDGRLVRSRPGPIPTAAPGAIRVELTTAPRAGYARVRRTLTAQIVQPSLALGARGPIVLALERRLAALNYALRGVDGVYGQDTYEAVLAFQKVSGLPRTGGVEDWLWRRLAQAAEGRVKKVVHVSTGATGNMPLGSWQVYRKVPGWDWVLWYPLYFKGGFAIHGYPSVPAYPASHGCVRIPMWIAPTLFGTHGQGTTVVVHQ